MTKQRRIRKILYWLILSVSICPLIAQKQSSDAQGTVFPIQVDWLSPRFSSLGIDRPRGLSLISPDYQRLNAHALKIVFKTIKPAKELDYSGKNLIFSNRLEDSDIINPQTVALNTFYQMKTRSYLHIQLSDICRKGFSEEKTAVRSEKLELIGADIAGQRVALRVSGNVNINGRLQNQKRSQVQSGYREGQSTTFVVDQKQQLNIEGKIGDRISILVDQDSERDFDFENALKIIYTGEEDDIVQKIEAGNVALSLPGTQFVTFSGKNNGLFGLKALMKLGGLDITTIASVEKGKKEKLSVDGGAQQTSNSIKDYEYRRNLYFFLDKDFRSTFYQGFIENGGRFTYDSSRVVADLEVYRSTNEETAGSVYGYAHVNPNDKSGEYQDYMEQRVFKRLVLDQDYIVSLNLGFIRLSSQIQENEILAVTYRTANSAGVTKVEYGDWDRQLSDTTDIELKLIKPQHMVPSHPCWDLEFKNVYYLGTSGINPDGFNLSIVYIHGTSGDEERDQQDGVSFLQKFGLDTKDKNGNPIPDDIIDLDNPALINLQMGELWLPFLRPFQFKENDLSGERNPNLSDLYSCSAMYDSNRTRFSDITEDSKFKIVYKYENRSSIINLGPMVIDGSESVHLGNETLTRGVDYTIDYFSGTITLLRQDALNPDANLDIKYERNQFFQMDKKTILGARAQYDFGENSFIGGTALYFSKSVVDEKVDVGYEPMRNFVWDLNGRFNKDLHFLTRAVNWLPLIKTDKLSSITFEGEIARVNPNPNTISNEDTGDPNGVGFIDDFEGSKRITSPPIMQRYWAPSACPLNKLEEQRGFMFWYNPYSGVPTRNIWPNKEVSTQAQNNTTEILVMSLDPEWSISVADGVSAPEEAWGGITYHFPTSYYDQSKTKFLEVWVRGNSGQLHIDLGQISEDYIPNGKLDTEDKAEAGFTLGNDLLDDGEDTGIDGVIDQYEFIVNTFGDTIRAGDDRLINYKRDPADPHSDNWKWSEGSSNYRYINGTENSKKDASGYIPDTEDLNRNFVVDLLNDYYSIDFPLDENVSDEYIAGRTKYDNGRYTGWKLYRIPLAEFKKARSDGEVNWQTIQACRLWFDGVTRQDTLMIAKIEMVGNEWEELGVAAEEGGEYIRKEEAFAVSVINSEDNPDTYEAPKGVQGEYDRINEIRMKEQSLVLWFDGNEGLKPGEFAAAKKVLFEEASFITYKKMKLFLNGYNIHTRTKYYDAGERTPLQFFVRFGRGGQNPQFYEYRQAIYTGWDKRNNMEIDLDFITALKGYNSEEEFPDNEEMPKKFRIIRDNNGEIIQRRYKEVKNGKYTGVEIIIHGSPAISRIQQLEVGIINQKYALADYDEVSPLPRYDNTVFGEIWLDELRLSDVRRDAGVAYRSKISLAVADLAKFDLGIDRKDADFHTVEQRPNLQPTGLNTTRNITARGSVSIDKLTPASWGLNLPVSGSYFNKVGTPKYIPGTDILSGDSAPDSIMNISESYGFNTSFSKRSSDFWLTKYTIDQLKVGFNAQWSNSSSVQDKQRESQNYKGNMSYKIPFGRDNYILPFKWIQNVPIIGDKLGALHWYYTPSSLEFNMDVGESKSLKIPRLAKSQTTETHDLGLNSSIRAGYKVFENLNVNYNKTMKNSLLEFRNDKLRAIKELNPGEPVSITESYTAAFSPKIFSWFSPTINYNAGYNWSEPLNSNTKSVDQMSNQNRISSSFSLDPKSIIKSFYSPKSAKSSSRPASARKTGRRSGRSTTYSPETETPTTPEKESGKDVKEIKILEYLYKALDRIDPIQISYSTSRNNRNMGRVGTPGLLYRMGLASDPGLEILRDEVGVNIDNVAINSDISMRSGLKISKNIKSSLSFGQNNSWTESQGQKSHTLTQDYITFDETGKSGLPFPSWTLNWSQIEKISFMSKIFKKLSLDHGFSGKEALVYRNGEEQSSSYKLYFSPLIGISMQFKNDINSSFRMTQGKTINNQSSGTSIVQEKNINASLNYQKKGGFTIPLPFMENKHLDNSMNFTMNFDYSSSITHARNSVDAKFTVQQQNKSWKIEPRISYSFTKKVTGALFYSYGESFNRRTGKRITRNGGFDVNIAIRG